MQGLAGARPKLFLEIPRIRDLLAPILIFGACRTPSGRCFFMSPESLAMFHKVLELKPYVADANYFSW